MAAPNLPRDGPPLNRPQSAKERYWLATLATRSVYLTPMDKLVFTRMLDLDRPTSARVGGCFASPAALAEDLGVTARTIETTRARLRRLGLLVRQEDAKGNPRWFPMVPAHVLVTPHPDLRGNGMDAWLQRQTERFNDAVCVGAHRERTRRLASRSQAASTSTPKNDAAGTEKVGTADRKKRGSVPKNPRVDTETSGGAGSQPRAPKAHPGRNLRDRDTALVVDVVNHGVGDGVSYEVTDPLTDVRGRSPSGRAADSSSSLGWVSGRETAGIPGGDDRPSDDPDDFSGWTAYRMAIMRMPGGPPAKLRWPDVRTAYLRARRGGITHQAMIDLFLAGEVLTPYIGSAA